MTFNSRENVLLKGFDGIIGDAIDPLAVERLLLSVA